MRTVTWGVASPAVCIDTGCEPVFFVPSSAEASGDREACDREARPRNSTNHRERIASSLDFYILTTYTR